MGSSKKSIHQTYKLYGISVYKNAGSGNDKLYGYAAKSHLLGGSGNDTVYGYGAWNKLDGGSGNDLIKAWGATNYLYGGSGHDRMYGYGAYNSCPADPATIPCTAMVRRTRCGVVRATIT